jgi:hypothetical protein
MPTDLRRGWSRSMTASASWLVSVVAGAGMLVGLLAHHHGAPEYTRPVESPSGELSVFWQDGPDGGIVVHPLDGSSERIIAREPYAIWSWSPDGTKVLLMGSGAQSFDLRAVAVDEPFTVELITDENEIPTNGSRSWPDRLNASWQALLE